MRSKYQDEYFSYVHVGDIVLLREGEVQIVGEVIFHERSKTADFENDKGAGLHVRVLFEMVETQGKCGMIERSGRFIKYVSPEQLTLLCRRRDEVRYLSGEVIKKGDIVIDPYQGGLDEDAYSVVEKGYSREAFFPADDYYGEKTLMKVSSAIREPSVRYGALVEEYWDDEGCVSDSMQHYFFISRAEEVDTYSPNM